MTRRATNPLFLSALAMLATSCAGCDDDACRPDGTCLRSGFVCSSWDDVCRPSCTVDGECGPGFHCLDAANVCVEGPRPVVDLGVAPDTGVADAAAADADVPDVGAADAGSGDMAAVDAGPVDSGVPPCMGEPGSEGCACFASGTCNFGFACAMDVCVDATGQQDQPCFSNNTCDPGLECVGRDLLSGGVCRTTATGTITGSCYDTTLEPSAQPCRSATAICEGGTCLGGPGDACRISVECASGFACEQGQCRSAPACRSARDCGSSQLCCGEPGTPFGAPGSCPQNVRVGDCFDAPDSTYAVSCTGHADCAPAPLMSPVETGISLCMDWGRRANICSAPCDPSLRSSGCPNEWQCRTSYLSCMTDEDCGAEGLTCVGAVPEFERRGRCQCGTVTNPVSCTSTSTSAMGSTTSTRTPTSTCTPEPGSNEAFCVVDAHCVPPGR